MLAASAYAPPRRLVIHGDNSADLAEAISAEFRHHPDNANLPRIEIIGVRGTIAQAAAGASFVGRLTAHADRMPLVDLDLAGWVAYRSGLRRRVPGRHRYTDLATLIAAMDATIAD